MITPILVRAGQHLLCLAISVSLILSPTVIFADVVIPDDSTVYLVTTETVIGKTSKTAVGQIVRARVWRDVVVNGEIVIRGGTPASTKVAHIKNRGMFGIKGEMSLAAVETKTIDGQTIYLTGGYRKEGGGRMLVSLGIGLLLFWPALFVLGKSAELPEGTVMDSFTLGAVTVATDESKKPTRSINLSAFMSGFSVEVLYDELTKTKKPKNFDFLITAPSDAPDLFVIDMVNGQEISPIELKIQSVVVNEEDEEKEVRVIVAIKKRAKIFKKGIKTFEIAYTADGERVSEEIIFQIEI